MGTDGSGCSRAEEKWCIQAGWLLEFEVEEEARNPGTQGSESLHQGAMCLQGKAGLQNCARTGHEEAEDDGQLSTDFPTDFADLSGRTRWIGEEVFPNDCIDLFGGIVGFVWPQQN